MRGVYVLWLMAAMPGLAEGKPDYQALMKLVFQDGRTVPVRSSIEEEKAEALEWDEEPLLMGAMTFPVGGKAHAALLISNGEDNLTEPLLLAVADVSGKEPRLVDVVDVRNDRWCSLYGDTPLALSRDTEGLAILCTHHNSQQGYSLYSFLEVREGRLVEMARVPLLSMKGVCGDSFEQTLEYSIRRAGKFNQLTITVKVAMEADDPGMECKSPMKASTRRYRATYHWDPKGKRFMTESKELEGLAKWNQERY